MALSFRQGKIYYLMIISLILLTAFVIQWLRSQYLAQKEILTGDLIELYISAQDEIVDSLLFKSYVNPVLSAHGPGMTGDIVTRQDTLVRDTFFFAGNQNYSGRIQWKGVKGAVTVNVEHDPASGDTTPDSIMIRRVNDDMLLRSLKLIVAHRSDSAGTRGQVMREFNIIPDTMVFKILFRARLDHSGMKFGLEWGESGKIESNDTKRGMLYLDPLNPFSLPPVSVTGYNGYIFARILPQAGFGFLLILITSLAFMLSYRSIREHELLNRMREEFISNITHELKTPVATLSVALESLERFSMKNEPAVMEEYLRLAGAETKRLGELINRVLDHSALEEKGLPVNPELISIAELAAETVDLMRHRLGPEGRISLINPGGDIMARVDPLYLKGVLINLIDNSIKYCDKTPEIGIFTGQKGGFAVIEVRDNGPGIPEEYRERIFEKFFRLPSGNIHNVKGYGLGLSFASLVIKLHGGGIDFVNNNPGCSFIIKLPLPAL